MNILYVSGHSVSLWHDGTRLGVYSLAFHHLPTDLTERRMRLMSRARELIAEHVASLSKHEDFMLVVGSPWVTYHTLTIEHVREQPFVFTRELEETLIKEEYIKIKKNIERTVGSHDDILLNIQVHNHKINGHKLADPFGSRGYRCELPVVVAFADRMLVHELLAMLEMSLYRDDIHVQSYWHWAQTISTPSSDTLFQIHLGSLTTDIMWVRDGIVSHTLSLPHGYESYYEEHTHKGTRHLDAHHTASDNPRYDEWMQSFTHIVQEWSVHHVPPGTIEIMIDDEHVVPLAHLLRKEITQLPLFTQPPQVILLQMPPGRLLS